MRTLWRIALAASLGLLPASAGAQVVNGSFEDLANPLNGWTPGPASRVEVLQSTSFSPNAIPVPDGTRYVLLSTGPGDVPGPPAGDVDANGTADHDASTLTATFTTSVADEKLTLSWSFLTDEVGPGGQGNPLYDDVFDITVDGVSILRGSVNKPGGSSPYPDTPAYDGLRYTVGSAGLTGSSDFGTAAGGGRTPFERLCVAVASPGTHILRLRVADQADSLHDSGLLVDAVEIAAACDPTVQVTDTAGASLEVENGGFVFTPVSNGRVALSGVGPLLAFRSNGNHTGDNPNLEEQIWTATPNGGVYSVSRVTSAVGADFGDPSLDANAQWLTFASNGDLAPPGNPDGNFEIFRYEIGSGALTQITSTAGCSNTGPTIGGAGSRIAFLSDCGLAPGTSGSEIVVWDGTFRGRDTSACTSREPRLSRDVAGRYVTFVTSCAGQYPGIANIDGGEEIVRWDTLTDLYLPVTNTPAGLVNDSPSSSADGRYIAFTSTGNHGGQNPTNAYVVFRYDATSGTYLRLTEPDPLALFTYAALDDSGGFAAVERLDLLTSAFDVHLVDAADPGVLALVASGSPTVTNTLPAVARVNGSPLVAYQSNGDATGGNPDANVEIWVGSGASVPPQPPMYCSSPSLALPDRANVTDTLTVTESGPIADLDVFVHIQHTWVGDLRIQLRHGGAAVWLIDRPGRPPGFGCDGDDVEATLDDEATLPVDDQCVTPGPVAISGTFSPEQALSAFDGLDVSGDWDLRIQDQVNRGAGTLVEWCLIPTMQ